MRWTTTDNASRDNRLSWKGSLAFAAACTASVLLFQAAQLRSSIHLLYNGEALGLSRLMWDVHTGAFEFTSIANLINGYSYLQFDQGTAVQGLLAAGLAPALGTDIWTFYIAGIILCAMGTFCFALVVTRFARTPATLLLVAPFLLPPLPLQTWRLMPWANHTHFLWVPALLALWLIVAGRDDARWRNLLAPIGIAAVGIALYRGNLAPAVAVAVTLASLGGTRNAGRAAVYVAGVAVATALILGVWLHIGWSSFLPYSGEFVASEPASFFRIPGRIAEIWGHLLAALYFTSIVEALHRLVLAAAVLLALTAFAVPARSPVLVTRFGCAWAVIGTLAISTSEYRLPTHVFPLYFAALLCFVSLAAWCPIRLLRVVAIAGAALLGLAGLVEGTSYIDRSVWPQTGENRGLQLYWTLDLQQIELDELQYYHRILDEGRGSSAIGLASGTLGLHCPNPISVQAGGDRPDPAADTCQAWTEGELCHLLTDDRFPAGELPGDLARIAGDIGRGAWIRGNRDLAGVERSFEGCPGRWQSLAIEGARNEAARWGE